LYDVIYIRRYDVNIVGVFKRKNHGRLLLKDLVIIIINDKKISYYL